MAEERVPVRVGDRVLALTHLDKPWWPGFSKRDALRYYTAVTPVLVPLLADRPASFVRAPDGVAGDRFVAKHVPPGAPEWVPRMTLEGKEGERQQVVVDDPATLMWAVNLGCVEFHVPQWRGDPDRHDRLVLDLDPGPGVDVIGCCAVALRLREIVAAEDGFGELRAVVSGSKGLHLYADCDALAEEPAVAAARRIAERLAEERPETVTAVMAKDRRAGRVFIDWSQNRSAKTTCSPYSLRLAHPDAPSVACPISWDEAEAAHEPEELRFTPDQALERLDAGA
ncbi:hypothetical protein BIV57_06780 [Mangrovactinospora gilvigrisea]|uniref:DNA ligase D polymerase domain-containing protein n=1 Tax=Mangrovactinospora gilvigrisea TaxID=1428644 RepID=A0A1J7BXL5_9ACTN|nr:hypothetical protein [Mangrovactinospora gilvigrisea]OIV38233.1 hypothetical protein BIV57_06780 [Mangrovactinospora gilvigrisea]